MSRERLPAVLAAAVVAAALVGCAAADDSSGTGGGDESVSTTTEAATTESTTTASTPPTTAGPSQPTAFTTTARDAVNELKAAWETGDQARARAIAPGDVVDALFLVPPDGYTVQGCDLGEFDTSYCNYRNRSSGGFINVAAQRYPEGWQIVTIDVGD